MKRLLAILALLFAAPCFAEDDAPEPKPLKAVAGKYDVFAPVHDHGVDFLGWVKADSPRAALRLAKRRWKERGLYVEEMKR